MFAMIEIPHQTPASFHIYEDDEALIDVAFDLAASRGEVYGEVDREKAIEILASDLHGHILVEDADDVRRVRRYTGHQYARVQPMAEHIAEALGIAAIEAAEGRENE